MKILKIKLENFQGLKTFEFSPNGENVSVFGDNGTGKTTLYNALCWLWFGKASTGEKGYSPKTAESHRLNHAVEIEIEHDGTKKSLKKVYHEVYKKLRGSKEETFSGHATDFYVDEIPVKEKEFQKILDGICPQEQAKMLMKYDYFLEDLNPEDARGVLLTMCGGVDEESIYLEDSFKNFKNILKGRTPEECLIVAKDKIKKLSAEESDIKSQIKGLRSAMGEIDIDIDTIINKISNLEKEKQDLESEKAAKSGTITADIRKQILEEKGKVELSKASYYSETTKESERLEGEKRALRKELDETNQKAFVLEAKIRRAKQDVENMNLKRGGLLEQWHECNNRQFAKECPHCGQILPDEMLEEKQKEFNLRKSENLERIAKEGQACSKEKISEKESEIKDFSEKFECLNNKIAELNTKIDDSMRKQVKATPFEETEEYKKLQDGIELLINKLESENLAAKESVSDINVKIVSINNELEKLREQFASASVLKKQKEQAEQLEKRLSELRAEREEYEYSKHLCEQFNRRKMELLEDKVNSKFDTIKFRLFEEQINGGVKDVCEALIPTTFGLVPFRKANNAARINAGLEMIDALSEHFGVGMPVFVDNCESVTKLRNTKCQQIRLYVSEKDKELRCECM